MMSTTLRPLSRTAATRLPRSFLVNSRPLPPRLSAPQWQSSAPLSTSRPLRNPSPHDRPQARALLNVLKRVNGNLDRIITAKGMLIASALFFALFAVQNALVKADGILRFASIQNNLYQLLFIDKDDALELFRVVNAVRKPYKTKDPLAADRFFNELERYIRRHEAEMQEFKVVFGDGEMNLQLHSNPRKVKILLTSFCLTAVSRWRNDGEMKAMLDIQDMVTKLKDLNSSLETFVGDITDVIHDEMD